MKTKKLLKAMLSTLLSLAILITASVPAYAEGDVEYLSDIRIVYGEDLEDARDRLEKSEFKGYKLFEYNLNEGTEAHMGFIGLGEEPHVYIAYQTTTDVDLAITDIAVMDMNGGYSEGSLKAMLEKSLEECEEYAEYYKEALDYFSIGYLEENPLSVAAYRQLNLYVDPDTNERLGDLLLADVDTGILSNILLKGNVNILENMRALIGMGVSYNEDGKTYLDIVEETAAEMDANPAAFEDQNWYELSVKVSGTFSVLRQMIGEYRAEKDSLDYTDDEVTEKEVQFLEHAAIVEMLEATSYLGGESLAEFIVTYQETDESYLSVYPLIAAMNRGQIAMTELFQFYNVIRYSTTALAADAMEKQIAELEENHKNGINIYLGVDLEIFEGGFAVTSAADRSAAASGRNVAADVFASTNSILGYCASGIGMIGNIGVLVTNLRAVRAAAGEVVATQVADAAARTADAYLQLFANTTSKILMMDNGNLLMVSPAEALVTLASKYNIALDTSKSLMTNVTDVLSQLKAMNLPITNPDAAAYFSLSTNHTEMVSVAKGMASKAASGSVEASNQAASAAGTGGITAGAAIMIFGAVTFAITALNVGIWLVNYYNPEMTDIPLAMVDVKNTEEGDRYIRYDAVLDINGRAADTNAFEGQLWNALYITRSYEAGPALTADIDISYDSNKAGENQISVHKFGAVDGFNLNKHAFGDEKEIYLSVTQSEDEKSGSADVPEVVGTLVSVGGYFLAVGLGIFCGVGVTMAAQKSKKKQETK